MAMFATAAAQSSADVYGPDYGGSSSDSQLKANGAPSAPNASAAAPTSTSAITQSTQTQTPFMMFVFVIGLFAGVMILVKLFDEWGKDHADLADVEVTLRNGAVVGGFALFFVPLYLALIKGIPWPWRNAALWQAFVKYVSIGQH